MKNKLLKIMIILLTLSTLYMGYRAFNLSENNNELYAELTKDPHSYVREGSGNGFGQLSQVEAFPDLSSPSKVRVVWEFGNMSSGAIINFTINVYNEDTGHNDAYIGSATNGNLQQVTLPSSYSIRVVIHVSQDYAVDSYYKFSVFVW